jgi:diguanylate cyclase (GGDEF)-like protein
MLGGVRLLARRQATSPAEEERRQGELARLLVAEFETQSSGWFWTTDRSGNLSHLSEKVARQVMPEGVSPLGEPLIGVFQPEASDRTERTLAFHFSSRTQFREQTVRSYCDDEERWWSISGRPIHDARGNFQGFAGHGSDLTEKRRSEAEITRLAMFDALTGLANRQRMRITLEQALVQTARSYRQTALLLLDLDRFKAVNDTLGHQVGDALLKQVAQRLGRVVGESGLVGRLGGDEFQVLVTGEVTDDGLADLARRIIANISQPYFVDGSSISVGVSIGIAVAPQDGGSPEDLTRNADLALYAAKGDGRGVHRFYRGEMLAGAQHRKQLEDDLRDALKMGGFHLVYQPVVSTEDARISGYEALLRWNHPVRGPISPADFIPVAEESGMIGAIGEWVLRTACEQAAGWPGSVRVAVNVSPIQFGNPAFPALVANTLARTGLAPGRLELEITEGVFLDETVESDKQFKALKALGVRLALDDFGTGYSSLGYLRSAPFDKIKIDQSFVRGSATPGNRNAAIIAAIVTLARTMGMETTAEGVEVQDEIDLIRALGCSHIQGYVYGRGVEADEVAKQLGLDGGVAKASGFRVSRAPRAKMLRRAKITIGGAQGDVRIRDLSATGAMIDGVAFEADPIDTDILIELVEGQMFAAKLRWAKDGRAGMEFSEPFNLDKLNPPTRFRKPG